MKLVLHFGMHKTGSSSIQSTLHACRGNASFRYVDLGTVNHSGPLSTAFMADPARYHSNRKRGLGRRQLAREKVRIREQLAAQLAQGHERLLVLSAEGFVGLDAAEMADFREFVGRWADDVVAVGYVRPLKGYLESSFQENLKGTDRRPSFQLKFDGYRSRFEKIEQVFGREQTRYWYFAPERFPGACVVQDFCARMDISLPLDRIVRVNEGIARDAAALLFAYKKFGPGYGRGSVAARQNHRLVTKLGELRGEKLRFAQALVAPVAEQHRDQVQWMEDRLGEPLFVAGQGDDAGSVHTEQDMLLLRPETLQWLARELGTGIERPLPAALEPEQIAERVHALMLGLASTRAPRDAALAQPAREPGSTIDALELVRGAARNSPGALDEVSETEAAALMRCVFGEILVQLGQQAQEVPLLVPALGVFRRRLMERERQGRKVLVSQILFRARGPEH